MNPRFERSQASLCRKFSRSLPGDLLFMQLPLHHLHTGKQRCMRHGAETENQRQRHREAQRAIVVEPKMLRTRKAGCRQERLRQEAAPCGEHQDARNHNLPWRDPAESQSLNEPTQDQKRKKTGQIRVNKCESQALQ